MRNDLHLETVFQLLVLVTSYHRIEAELVLEPPPSLRLQTPQTVQVHVTLSERLIKRIQQNHTSTFYIGLRYDKHDQYFNNILHFTVNGEPLPKQDERYPITKLIDLSYLEEPKESNATNITNPNTFTMSIQAMGYVSYTVDILEYTRINETRTLISTYYDLTAYRATRIVDVGFNVAVTILAVLNTFAMGCLTELQIVRQQLTEKLKLAVAFITQYIAVPLITLGLTRAASMQNEIALGLLYLTCLPGGGLGHLIAAITNQTDLELSIAINTFEMLLPIVVVPLYVYTFGNILPNSGGTVPTQLYYLVLWNVAMMIPYAVGLLVRRHKEVASEACLNWIIKPVLLLAFILFITLGLYINMYMFGVLNNAALVVGGMIPFLGFLIGGALGLVFKLGKPAAKSIAIEAAIMNCIMAMVGVRFTLPQPDADLASAGAMWVLFITPIPFLLMFIFHRIKRKVMSYFEKRKLEKQQRVTMLQSFAAITHNALQIGGFSNAANDATSSNLASNPTAEHSQSYDMLLLKSTSQYSTPSHLIIANTNVQTPGDQSHDRLLLDTEPEQQLT